MSTLKCSLLFAFPFLFLACASNRPGVLDLISGYEHDVMVRAFYDFDNTSLETFYKFRPGTLFLANSRNKKYSYLTKIQIETPKGEILAEYPPDYLLLLRNSYPQSKGKGECWVFTKKGLFMRTSEKRNYSEEKALAYYRSDDAVQDLEFWLKSAGLLEEFREKYGNAEIPVSGFLSSY